MNYLTSLMSKWMPDKAPVKVDSHPRLSGIMDTINSTLAHGPETRLPSSFYNPKALAIIDKISVEEWFSGFKENNEYRKVGIGALAGDIVARMVDSVESGGYDGLLEVGGEGGKLGARGRGQKNIKFAMSGCHDTTLAALLSSLGCFDGEDWPPYTSAIAFELFNESGTKSESIGGEKSDEAATATASQNQHRNPLKTLFGRAGKPQLATGGISRKPTDQLTDAEKNRLKGHYVRIRYNDRPMIMPGCRLPGKHLEGDESFCTLVSRIVYSYSSMLISCRKHSRLSSTSSHPRTGSKLAYLILAVLRFRLR